MGCVSAKPVVATYIRFYRLQDNGDDKHQDKHQIKAERYVLSFGAKIDLREHTLERCLNGYEKFEGTRTTYIDPNSQMRWPEYNIWVPVREGTAGARWATDFNWWSMLVKEGLSDSLKKRLLELPLVQWTQDKTLGVRTGNFPSCLLLSDHRFDVCSRRTWHRCKSAETRGDHWRN